MPAELTRQPRNAFLGVLIFLILIHRLPSWRKVKESRWPVFAAIARLEQFLQFYVTDMLHLWEFAPCYLRRFNTAADAQLQTRDMFRNARVVDIFPSSVFSKFVAG